MCPVCHRNMLVLHNTMNDFLKTNFALTLLKRWKKVCVAGDEEEKKKLCVYSIHATVAIDARLLSPPSLFAFLLVAFVSL